jgi:undecaprenyl-diphosphatase
MGTLQAIILGLIQGLTEFLPISSSAHLGMISYIFNWNEQLQLDIVLHVASLLALIIYFRKDLKEILQDLINTRVSKDKANSIRFTRNIIISLLPLFPFYFLLKESVASIQNFSQISLILLIVFGAFLIWADLRSKNNSAEINNINKTQALLIGVGQGIALFSGVSRSGITITIALLLGLKDQAAKKYTFLLSIPTILGGFLLELIDIIKGDVLINFDLSLILAIISAFISAYLALLILFKLGDKIKLYYYGIYRIIIGLILLMILF